MRRNEINWDNPKKKKRRAFMKAQMFIYVVGMMLYMFACFDADTRWMNDEMLVASLNDGYHNRSFH